MRDQVITNRSDIDSLQTRVEEAVDRAAVSDVRADELRHRIDDLEAGADVHQHLIAELKSEGLLRQKHVTQLEEALRTSRRIGIAIGIIMVARNLDATEAFSVLVSASQNTDRKVSSVADDVVRTGDVSDLLQPQAPQASPIESRQDA